MRERIGLALASAATPWVAAALGVVLTLPSLGAGLIADDYLQRAVLQDSGVVPVEGGPWSSLFTFVPGTPEGNQAMLDAGVTEWTVHPQMKISFWRPLTVATHVLDYALWPDGLVLQHAHSLLWYALAVLAVAALYRRTIPSLAAAGLAALLFAVQDYHATAACWLANRNALISVALGALALVLHVRWRRGGGAAEAVGAPLCLAASLLAGESGLALAAYLAAYQLAGEEGSWGRRLKGLLPAAVVVLAWLVAYRALGYGVVGSGLYVDPARDPLGYGLALLERGPLLLAGQWVRAPVDLWIAMPVAGRVLLAVTSAGAVAGIGVLLVGTLRARREARFWGLGMVLALLPLCANFPMDRVLVTLGLGALALLAIQVERLGWLGGDGAGVPPGWSRRLVAGATGLLLVLHGPLAALALPGRVLIFKEIMGTATSSGADGLPDDPALEDQAVIYVNGFVLNTSFLVRCIRHEDGLPVPRQTMLLASQLGGAEVEVLDERTMVIRQDGGFLRYGADILMRDPRAPFEVGQRIRLPELTVEVTELRDDGRPAEATFHFDRPLHDDTLRFVYFTDEGLQPFPLPEEGEVVHVDRAPPPGWEPVFMIIQPLWDREDLSR